MKKEKFTLTLPNQCHQNWQEMASIDKDKWCSKCSKVILDFSRMSDREIALLFSASKPGTLCGRFSGTQLNRAYTAEIEKTTPGFFHPASILLIGLLSLKLPVIAQVNPSRHTQVKKVATQKKIIPVAPLPVNAVINGIIRHAGTKKGIPATVRLWYETPTTVRADSMGNFQMIIPLAGLKNDSITLAFWDEGLGEITRTLSLSDLPGCLEVELEKLPVIELLNVQRFMGIPQMSPDEIVIRKRRGLWKRFVYKIKRL